MCSRNTAFWRLSRTFAFSSARNRPAPNFTKQSQPRFKCAESRVYHNLLHREATCHNKSASGFFTVVVILGIAVGGALLVPIVKPNSTEIEHEKHSHSYYARSTDSFLIMPSDMPPGRPGTLTPQEEVKLRELWAATMRVFGTYEPLAIQANGTETAPSVAPSEVSEKDGKKEKEKKSRLRVFRRNKGEKGGDTEANPSSTATPTPADISSMSIADDEDKHGQTKDFRAAIANTSPEDLRKSFWSMVKLDHPDALLLRFLRARKWDVEKALVMMISTMHWRLDQMHVDDDIIFKGEEGALLGTKSDDAKVKKEAEDFLTQLRMGKSYLHGMDGEGRPLCIVRARLHRAGEQSESSLERFTVYTIESARMLLRPPVDTATIVFDMTDFSMANMDYAPVKFMIRCFEANYPESLGNILVYKAPWIFNAIWSIIRGWLDPVVAGKVHFAKNVEELEKIIPRNQIPTELGGDEKWEYQYVEPKEGENAKMKEEAPREVLQAERVDLVKKYEKTILEWVNEGDEGKTLEERRKERDVAAEELKQNYWKLDPYLRARTLYDRTGLIGEGGQLHFYPKDKKEKETVTPVPATTTQETSPDDLD